MQLARAVEQSSLLVIITDAAGKIEYVSPRFTQVTGYLRDQLIGRNVNLLNAGHQPAALYQVLWETIQRGEEWRGEFCNRKKNGDLYWTQTVITPIKNTRGRITHYVALQEEITERKRVEAELKKSEAEFRALFEHVPHGVYRILPNGKPLMANPALVQMLGYASREEFVQVDGLSHFQTSLEERTRLTDNLEALGELQGIELVLRRADGQPITVLGNAYVVRDEQGGVLYYEGTVTDITERKRNEEELARYAAILSAVNFAAEQFLRASSWRDQINPVIARLGRATRVSRVYIFENRRDENGMLVWHQVYEWVAEGITAQIKNPVLREFNVVAQEFGRWSDLMEKGELVKGKVKDLPASEQTELLAEEIKSILCVPILVQGKWWGLIGFDDCLTEREWSAAETDALVAAANTLGAAIEQDANDRFLRAQTRHLSLLNEITRTALATPDLKQMIQLLADQLSQMLGADACYITLWDESRERVLPMAASGPLRETYPTMMPPPGETTMTRSVLQAEQVLLAEDTFNSPYVSPQVAAQFPNRSMMGLPLIAGGHKLGAVLVTFDQTHHFTPDEIERASQAAGQIALALAQAFALDAEQQRARELEAVRQASLALTSTLDLPAVLDAILDSALKLSPTAQDAHLYLYENNDLIFGASLWADGRRGQQWSVPRINGLTYTVAREGRMIVVSDIRRHALFADAPADWHGAIIGLPVKIAEHVVGVMTIAYGAPRDFSQNELRVLKLLAAQAAIAIENARLYSQVQQLAVTDSLVDLYNRRGLLEMGERELNRARRLERPLSAILFDIDHFKQVNDTYGHAVGDLILKAVAERCYQHIRLVDILARYGGEEFVVLLPDTDLAAARRIAERLREATEQMVTTVDGITITVTLSLGVAELTPDIIDLAALIERADQAQYRAKQAGRNRTEVFQEE